MKTCPKCNTKTLNTAAVCDCGYAFGADLQATLSDPVARPPSLSNVSACRQCGKTGDELTINVNIDTGLCADCSPRVQSTENLFKPIAAFDFSTGHGESHRLAIFRLERNTLTNPLTDRRFVNVGVLDQKLIALKESGSDSFTNSMRFEHGPLKLMVEVPLWTSTWTLDYGGQTVAQIPDAMLTPLSEAEVLSLPHGPENQLMRRSEHAALKDLLKAPNTFTGLLGSGSTSACDSRQCFKCGKITTSKEPLCRFCDTRFRPLGVGVIGGIYIVGGIGGIILIGKAPLFVILGVVNICLGVALLKGRPQARTWAVVISLLNLLSCAWVVLVMSKGPDKTLIELFIVGLVLNWSFLVVLMLPRTIHYFRPLQVPSQNDTDFSIFIDPRTRQAIGLIVGIIALCASLLWMHAGGDAIQSPYMSHIEPVDPVPPMVATTASVLWTAFFGCGLARAVKEGRKSMTKGTKQEVPITQKATKCIKCGCEDALILDKSVVTGAPLPNRCPACGHTWESERPSTTKPLDNLLLRNKW